MPNVLVTAAGCPGFITICKSLRSIKSIQKDLIIHACDANSKSLGLNFADKTFLVPFGDSPEYISVMREYCKANKIDFIIPASDTELIPLSTNKKDFESFNCKILVSGLDSLEIILDKSSLYSYCAKSLSLKNIVPAYETCNNLDSFKNSYKNLSSYGTLCVKPAKSNGSRGFRVIKPLDTVHSFFYEKPSSRNITYENLCEVLSESRNSFPDLLLMEYMPGEEFSVDCVKFDSKFYCVTRRRDIIKDGICSTGTAIKKPELIEICRELYESLNLSHNVNIQFRYDSSGNPKLLEINPRVAGSMELCRGAGINFIQLSLEEAMGISKTVNQTVRWGTKMTRVWEEIFCHEDDLFLLESIKEII